MLSHGIVCISDRAKCSTQYRMLWLERRPNSKVNIHIYTFTIIFALINRHVNRRECVVEARLTFDGKKIQQIRLIFTLTWTVCAIVHVLISNDIRRVITRQLIPIHVHCTFLHLIVAFCAHFNSIMHNKSWTFHFFFPKFVMFVHGMRGGGTSNIVAVTLKLCHEYHSDAPMIRKRNKKQIFRRWNRWNGVLHKTERRK